MTETIALFLDDGHEGIANPILRYGLLERIASAAALRGITVYAFGIGHDEIRLVVDGERAHITNLIRGIKVGTARAACTFGHRMLWAETLRTPVVGSDLTAAVAWAHATFEALGASGPLATPWTSHRDVLGYRTAAFYDASVLEGRVDVAVLHEQAGGGALPDGWPPEKARQEPLNELLRVAASVLGVLPADRSSFALFTHLARSFGYETRHIADALMLTRRRVRQLSAEPVPALPMALETLADPRLRVMP